MITDSILRLLNKVYIFVISLLPRFDFITDLANAKEKFIDFFIPILEHTLYVFNVPILRLSLSLLTLYIMFLVTEYFVKLIIKYITNVI